MRRSLVTANVRVRDVKHTFGRRLRAGGVRFEDRQDLLDHRSGRITTHYSTAECYRLVEAAETVVKRNEMKPEPVVLRGSILADSRETPAQNDFQADQINVRIENIGRPARSGTVDLVIKRTMRRNKPTKQQYVNWGARCYPRRTHHNFA